MTAGQDHRRFGRERGDLALAVENDSQTVTMTLGKGTEQKAFE